MAGGWTPYNVGIEFEKKKKEKKKKSKKKKSTEQILESRLKRFEEKMLKQ